MVALLFGEQDLCPLSTFVESHRSKTNGAWRTYIVATYCSRSAAFRACLVFNKTAGSGGLTTTRDISAQYSVMNVGCVYVLGKDTKLVPTGHVA